jgi:hypothetical protein
MFFADTVALIILRSTPLPIFQLMGGIRLSPSEQTIQTVALLVGFLGVVSWPVWFIGLIVVGWPRPSEWKLEWDEGLRTPHSARVWGLAAGSVAAWIFVLPHTQSEQQLKWRVDRDLRGGRLQEAVAILSAHERKDFPPHWDPPPRLGYGETNPRAKDVLMALIATDARPWVRAVFAEKFDNETRTAIYSDGYGPFREELSDELLDEYLTLSEQHADRTQIVKDHYLAFERELEVPRRPAAIHERIRRLFEEAGYVSPEATTSPAPTTFEAHRVTGPVTDQSDPKSESQ